MNYKKIKIDSVSSTFCLAKWLQVTIDLVHGQTHSCHHPERHKIPFEELKKNVSALHNTNYKKTLRRMMLDGQRPSECEYCWNLEDTQKKEKILSDRYIKSTDPWAFSHLDKIANLDPDENINPTYMEVMLDDKCQMACSYCMADVSSSISNELNKFGKMPIEADTFRAHQAQEQNSKKYYEAFWNWLPQIIYGLRYLRVTGGEPFLSLYFDRVITIIQNSKTDGKTIFAVNTNLSLPWNKIKYHLDKIQQLIKDKKIKAMELYVSIDAIKSRAEYIRMGLNFKLLNDNLDLILKDYPNIKVVIMNTLGILSLSTIREYLAWIVDKKKAHSDLVLDTSYLLNPDYFCITVADKGLIQNALKEIEKYRQQISTYEYDKFKRALIWAKHKIDNDNSEQERQRSDFYLFIKEFDFRYNKKFINIFPEYEYLLNLSQKASLVRKYEFV